jgi:membrane-bound serine protease (ClpP class)
MLAGLMLWPATAGAQDDEPGRRGIDVVQVNGLLDPPNAALVRDSLRDAERKNSTVVVFQFNGGGAVDVDVAPLVREIKNATVPVAAWIGPSGGGAKGATALLALSAPVVGIAPGAHVGPVLPVRWDRPTKAVAVADEVGDARTRRFSGRDALDAGIVDGNEATLQEFVVSLDGETIPTADGPVELSLLRGEPGNRRLNQTVRFHKLDLLQQLAHTLNTPWVAYFLFVAGLALIVFEFFTAGVGVAGVVGAFALIGACFGFSHLPVALWAVGLLMLGILGLAIDVQAGTLGPWTFIGGAALIAGSIWLYNGSSRLDPQWWVLLTVCGGTLLFMISGMTAMVRSRFSTPTIGREDLVGEMGTAEVDVDPDGVVRIHDALWRARTNRATPIHSGDSVRVVAVEGIVLEVEPETGGARDYRERRGRSRPEERPT